MAKMMLIVWRRSLMLLVFGLMMASPASAQEAGDDAAIRNLMSRYVWALDGKDAESYALVFAPDGVLVHGGGEERGRDMMRQVVQGLLERERATRAADTNGLRPARPRHFMTNLVIEIDGDRARVKDYWFHLYNNNAERSPYVTSYGHAENELVKLDGEWFIAHRRIYNEQSEDRWARDDNPSFQVPRD
jgi:hypothetical protein